MYSVSDAGAIAAQLSSNPLIALPLLFFAGVLTSLTPCVYPMIPITVAIVGGQSADRPVSRWTSAGLTFCYVIGLASVYAALGTLAGMTGTLFGTVSTNPWLYFMMANLLVYVALMMIDVVPVPIPQSWTARAASAGTRRGRYGGAFAMGAASGLVAAPCSAPVMAAVLTWVTTTRSAPLGFLYLFVFSLGMCALLVVVGLSSGAASRLPRAGRWTIWVKWLFAAIMLGVAEYYLVQMGRLLI